MASIKELIQSIESGDSSFDEKLAAINQMEETLIAMRNNEEQAVNDNVELIVEAIKVMEKKVNDQLEIAKSIVPEKGDKGDRGLDGAPGRDGVNGRDGRDGKDGQNGQDGADGVSVTDAKIDFDGSLIITLSTGREINVGEVVASDLAEKIKVISTMSTNTAIADITGGTINNTVIGGTTPAAGTFTTLIGGGGSANYFQTQGSASTKAVEVKALGSDSNIAFVIDSKGTGAIDLAAGSSGVNISNGGTVTALTRTANGTGYTSKPTMVISAPTTAGGVQAVADFGMFISTVSIVGGGTGYTAGDILTVSGGTFTTQAQLTVSTVSSGVITAVTVSVAGVYSVLTTNPISVTGGTGSGATFNVTTWGLSSAGFVITNAGSGYVEQPTVSFSGGGGSGAAAYATVGAGTIIRALGATGTQALDFHTAASATNTVPALRLRDVSVGTSNTGFVQIQNNNGYSSIIAQGPTNAALNVASNGTGNIQFNTNSTNETQQLRVSHTASAVNYVQVTGAATTARPTISAQGSDSSVGLNIYAKGGGSMIFSCNGTVTALQLNNTSSGVNYLQMAGAVAGSGPVLSAAGGDTNIDLALTPKGTGMVRFGTRTASADAAITGYIEIKDSGGTTRRLAVIG